MWPDPADNDANIAWVRGYYDATAPAFEGGRLHQLHGRRRSGSDQGELRPNYDRLVEVKRAYDPDNLFRRTRTSSRDTLGWLSRACVRAGRVRRYAAMDSPFEAPTAELMLDTRTPAELAWSPDGSILAFSLHATVADVGSFVPATST